MNEPKTNRKTRVGIVISDKMDKSAVVLIERTIQHPLYGKFIRRRVKYMAHDPENTCQIGDRVMIEECRPLSKRKRWRVKEVVERAII
jgi:small subunit ribosomal protein S17